MQASSQVQKLLDAAYTAYQHNLDALISSATDILESLAGNSEETVHAIREYTSAASQLANDYYEQTRQIWRAAGVNMPDFEHARLLDPDRALWQVQGGFNNTDFNGLTYAQVKAGQSRAGMTINDLWPDVSNIDTAQQLVADMIQSSARLTTQRNMRMDPVKPRWARVPQGETCEFCLMLASRGWVYWSEESARLGGGFHKGHCDCKIVPSWGKQALKGYDPGKLYAQYKECADTVARLTTRERYYQYRDRFTPTDQVPVLRSYESWKRSIELAEMRWRDKHWLNTGEPPLVEFETSELEDEIRSKRSHEIRTAERLCRHGVKTTFIVDHEYLIGSDGLLRERGLADFQDGTEIKTLREASTRNSIESHLKNTSRKKGAVRVIFDNVENENLSDEALKNFIQRSRRFKHGSVYMLTKEEELIKIR